MKVSKKELRVKEIIIYAKRLKIMKKDEDDGGKRGKKKRKWTEGSLLSWVNKETKWGPGERRRSDVVSVGRWED